MSRKLPKLSAPLLALAALAGALPATPAAAAQARTAAPAGVEVSECLHGPAQDGRRAAFKAAMGQVRGGRQMAMRFRLEERVGGGAFATVRAPGLGVWRRSRPGVRRFAHLQRVVALAEGSAYRVVVSFRWYGEHGKVLRRAVRRSRPCRQPGLLPNLLVVDAGVRPMPIAPGTFRYWLRVANRGAVASGDFDVSLAVDGALVDSRRVSSLAPGERRRVFITGPACTVSVEGRVDPADRIRESLEGDNVLSSSCPSTG
jgi:CARDB